MNKTPQNPPARVYLLDKPPGTSSFAALGALKKRIGTHKVGHAGTLDPFATGLLTAMVGKMTRVASLLSDSDKVYRTVIRFGEETDTGDPEGQIIAHAPPPDIAVIHQAIRRFTGAITQKPPMFSAVKIQGQRAYQLARQGQTVEIPERQVHIHQLEIQSWEPPDLSLRICCSKGTYIRSLARDMGLACQSRAHCILLRRLAVGPFNVEMALDAKIAQYGLSPKEFCRAMNIPILTVNTRMANAMSHGRPLHTLNQFLQTVRIPQLPPANSQLLVLGEDGGEIALMTAEGGEWRYGIVF